MLLFKLSEFKLELSEIILPRINRSSALKFYRDKLQNIYIFKILTI